MDKIISFVISLTLLLMIYALVSSIIEKSKSSVYIKNTLLLVVIIISFSFILDFNETSDIEFDIYNFQVDKNEVWERTLDSLEVQTAKHIKSICNENGLSVETVEVELKTDFSEITIESVRINGSQSLAAKNLIVGHLNINPAYITISGE